MEASLISKSRTIETSDNFPNYFRKNTKLPMGHDSSTFPPKKTAPSKEAAILDGAHETTEAIFGGKTVTQSKKYNVTRQARQWTTYTLPIRPAHDVLTATCWSTAICRFANVHTRSANLCLRALFVFAYSFEQKVGSWLQGAMIDSMIFF